MRLAYPLARRTRRPCWRELARVAATFTRRRNQQQRSCTRRCVCDNRAMLTQEEKQGLGVAFNEATLLGAEVDPTSRVAGITLSVLALPETGPSPGDSRLQVLLHGVSRVAASLRLGNWNDVQAPMQSFELSELLCVVQSFGGCAMYGWEFFDLSAEQFESWQGKFSLDVTFDETPGQHSISLFQEGHGDRHLDLCIWFSDIQFRHPVGDEISLSEVIAAGKRWWDALYQKDPRVTDRGIIPLQS